MRAAASDAREHLRGKPPSVPRTKRLESKLEKATDVTPTSVSPRGGCGKMVSMVSPDTQWGRGMNTGPQSPGASGLWTLASPSSASCSEAAAAQPGQSPWRAAADQPHCLSRVALSHLWLRSVPGSGGCVGVQATKAPEKQDRGEHPQDQPHPQLFLIRVKNFRGNLRARGS